MFSQAGVPLAGSIIACSVSGSTCALLLTLAGIALVAMLLPTSRAAIVQLVRHERGRHLRLEQEAAWRRFLGSHPWWQATKRFTQVH